MDERTSSTELPRPFLTVKQVAKILQASPPWVYSQCHKGKFPAKQFGRLWRIDRQKFEAMLEIDDETPPPNSPTVKPTPAKPVAHLDAKKILAAWQNRGIVNLPEQP